MRLPVSQRTRIPFAKRHTGNSTGRTGLELAHNLGQKRAGGRDVNQRSGTRYDRLERQCECVMLEGAPQVERPRARETESCPDRYHPEPLAQARAKYSSPSGGWRRSAEPLGDVVAGTVGRRGVGSGFSRKVGRGSRGGRVVRPSVSSGAPVQGSAYRRLVFGRSWWTRSEVVRGRGGRGGRVPGGRLWRSRGVVSGVVVGPAKGRLVVDSKMLLGVLVDPGKDRIPG
jgi:hypothetical protein